MRLAVRLVDRLADLALYALAGFAAACLTTDEPEPDRARRAARGAREGAGRGGLGDVAGGVVTGPRNIKPHLWRSSVGHMTIPEDASPCCPYGPSHPIHLVPTPERTCECPRMRFPHFWGKGCPA